MEYQAIQENRWINETAKICGEVVVDCSDTAGALNKALHSAGDLQEKHLQLETIMHQLSVEIENVAQATEEARDLSDSARIKVAAGSATVSTSLSDFTDMIALINRLGTHITGFAAAMDQVKRASQAIDSIARTTNMLALNAAIEAQKAGAAVQTFAVVAAEVKKLALDSRSAAVEITGAVNSLSAEAEKLVVEIGTGIEGSGKAQAQFGDMEQLLTGLSDIVSQVDKRTSEIAANTAAINDGLAESRRVRHAVDSANKDMQFQLSHAHQEVTDLELLANMMFDKLVHSGLSSADLEFVEMAQAKAQAIVSVTEAAIADGSLSMDALFDKDYQPVPGSNPPRFTTRLTKWAEQNWQPIIEGVKAARPDAILSCVPTSREGFLPIHLKEFSRTPTGDVAHDTKYCRNGRILNSGIDEIAKASDQDYMMAVYRHEGDGKTHQTVRNVYVPLWINGRRWGDAEIAYII